MNNEKDTSKKEMITREEAGKLLFEVRENNQINIDCFDKYGNYAFPTDITISSPNTAMGTSIEQVASVCLKNNN